MRAGSANTATGSFSKDSQHCPARAQQSSLGPTAKPAAQREEEYHRPTRLRPCCRHSRRRTRPQHTPARRRKKRDERRNATPADAIATLLATSVLKWDSTRRAAHSCACTDGDARTAMRGNTPVADAIVTLLLSTSTLRILNTHTACTCTPMDVAASSAMTGGMPANAILTSFSAFKRRLHKCVQGKVLCTDRRRHQKQDQSDPPAAVIAASFSELHTKSTDTWAVYSAAAASAAPSARKIRGMPSARAATAS